jgi:hypothetical protein
MIRIAVMHVPRQSETVGESIISIKNNSKGVITLMPDGVHDTEYISVQLGIKSHSLGKQVGCFKHYARCLEYLVSISKGNDIIAVLPDDLIYSPFDNLIEKALTPNVGYCAIYTPRELGRRNKWKFGGWESVNGGWDSSYGGGYFFRAKVAKQIIEHPFFIDHLNNYEKNQQIDHCIPEVCHQLGLKQLFHVPSLSKHIGLTSTIGHVHTEAEEPWGWK